MISTHDLAQILPARPLLLFSFFTAGFAFLFLAFGLHFVDCTGIADNATNLITEHD